MSISTYPQPATTSGSTILPEGYPGGPAKVNPITGPWKNYETSFPTSSSYSGGYSTGFPTSLKGARRSRRSTPAAQQSQRWVRANVIPAQWPPGVRDYTAELFPGQYLFSVEMGNVHTPLDETRIMNLRQVNTLLNDGYNTGVALLARNVDKPTGKPIPGTSAIERVNGGLSISEYDLLMDTPTTQWSSLECLRRILSDATLSELHHLRYLYEEGMESRFKFMGVNLGKMDTEMAVAQMDVAIKGCIEDVENIWGDDIRAADRIYLIYKRRLNPRSRRFGAFAFIPWYGNEDPTTNDTYYRDVVDVDRWGTPIYLGKFDCWLQPREITPSDLRQAIGLEPLTTKASDTMPEPRCCRLTFAPPPGSLFHHRF